MLKEVNLCNFSLDPGPDRRLLRPYANHRIKNGYFHPEVHPRAEPADCALRKWGGFYG
jgi:hypothetical protein